MIRGESLKYITAILSSKLMSFAYKTIFSSIELGTSGYQYNKHALEKLPIPQISTEQEKQYINLINKILEAKRTNPSADTSALEQEIDLMVYSLYGLTEEEINLIEKQIRKY